jgi:hypothetical protein
MATSCEPTPAPVPLPVPIYAREPVLDDTLEQKIDFVWEALLPLAYFESIKADFTKQKREIIILKSSIRQIED